jgi:hypothetical protein
MVPSKKKKKKEKKKKMQRRNSLSNVILRLFSLGQRTGYRCGGF